VYNDLKSYVRQHGAPPATKNSYLGNWIRTQRVAYQKSTRPASSGGGWPASLVSKRKHLLENIPGWTWDASQDSANRPDDVTWMQRFIDLSRFLKSNNGLYPPVHWKRGICASDRTLSQWIYTQMMRHRRGALSEERTRCLSSLPGWSFVKPLSRVGSGLRRR